MLLALHLIKTGKSCTSAVIGVDDHAALEAFSVDLRSPGHHLTKEILGQGNMVQKRDRAPKRLR
jgi:hypothetical protein